MWIGDVALSIILFTAACIIAFGIVMNSFSQGSEFSEVRSDASKISEFLMSDGIPSDWNQSSIIRPGILTSNRINHTKVQAAMALSNSSYSLMQASLQTGHDFAVTVEDRNGQMISFDGYCVIGKQGSITNGTNSSGYCNTPVFNSISSSNLAKITRIAIYNSTLVRVKVYVWE